MMPSRRFYALALGAFLVPACAYATKPKLDRERCAQLRLEETKFRKSGIQNDMSKGPAWAQANLSPARLREVQYYIELDEQIQFGCRDAKLSIDAAKASEAAARIELNSDADPTMPVVKDPAKPGAVAPEAATRRAATPAAKPKKAPPKSKVQKPKLGDPKTGDAGNQKKQSRPLTQALPAPKPSVSESSGSANHTPDYATDTEPTLPAFGFGETVVLPHSSP